MWHPGPVPAGTFGLGRVVLAGVSPSAGTDAAHFCGNKVLVHFMFDAAKERRLDQIGWYEVWPDDGPLEPNGVWSE